MQSPTYTYVRNAEYYNYKDFRMLYRKYNVEFIVCQPNTAVWFDNSNLSMHTEFLNVGFCFQDTISHIFYEITNRGIRPLQFQTNKTEKN